ncbi:MAG: c-type cytochrome [Actinomycetota bacterium]
MSPRPARALGPLLLAGALALAGCGADGPAERELDATAQRGEELLAVHGCIGCHSVDGSDRTGPTFLGQWGTERELDDGRVVVFDAEHVAAVLADPSSRSRADVGARMPAFPDLPAEEVEAITAYLEALGDGG